LPEKAIDNSEKDYRKRLQVSQRWSGIRLWYASPYYLRY